MRDAVVAIVLTLAAASAFVSIRYFDNQVLVECYRAQAAIASSGAASTPLKPCK